MFKRLLKTVDLATTAAVLPTVVGYYAARGLLARRRSSNRPRPADEASSRVLLVIQTMHSYASVVDCGHQDIVRQSGLEGFFEHVYTLYPTLGADPEQPITKFDGPRQVVEMDPSNTFVEYKLGRYGLKHFPTLDFVLSQAVMLNEVIELAESKGVSAIRANCPFFTGLYAMALSRILTVPYSLRIGCNFDLLNKNGRMSYRKIFRRYSVAKRVANIVFRNADSVCAVNENNLEYCLDNGARPENSVVVRYGNVVDKIHFGPIHGRPGVLGELGVDTNRPIAVCVGTLTKIKHPEDVVEATRVACERIPNLLTIFVGSNGSMRGELEEMAHAKGISSNVMFLGKRNQEFLASIYREADVYLSPLTGRCLVEAALAGLPLIAYDFEWHGEFVKHDKTGWLIPYRNSQAMGEALAMLIEDHSLNSRLGGGSRALALEMMDKQKILKQEQDAYLRVL